MKFFRRCDHLPLYLLHHLGGAISPALRKDGGTKIFQLPLSASVAQTMAALSIYFPNVLTDQELGFILQAEHLMDKKEDKKQKQKASKKKKTKKSYVFLFVCSFVRSFDLVCIFSMCFVLNFLMLVLLLLLLPFAFQG